MGCTRTKRTVLPSPSQVEACHCLSSCQHDFAWPSICFSMRTVTKTISKGMLRSWRRGNGDLFAKRHLD